MFGVVCSVGRSMVCSLWCWVMCGEWCGLRYGAMRSVSHCFSTSASDSNNPAGLDIFVLCTTANEKQLAITDDGIVDRYCIYWVSITQQPGQTLFPHSTSHIITVQTTGVSVSVVVQLQKSLVNERKICSNTPQQASSR